MKHRSFMLALALAAGVVAAARPARAQEQPEGKPKTGAPSSQEKAGQSVTVAGQVTSAEGGLLTVTDAQKAEHKIAVTDQTKVTKGGKEATAADLKMSDKVTVRATKGGDGALTAVSIDISGE